MLEYKTLARIFHADQSGNDVGNHEALAWQRLEADSSFRTGIVTSLGELFVAMPRFLSLRMEELLCAERQVAHLWEAMPVQVQEHYVVQAISEELLTSNQMEGVRSTRAETDAAVRAAAKESGSARGVRFGEFAKLYINLTHRKAAPPQSLEDIRRVYDAVVLGEVAEEDWPDGELFRAHDVDVHGPHGVLHQGVSGELRIGSMLTKMMDLLNDSQIPKLPAAIMGHFLFEYAHPFYDGNGRTGRYLLALSLADSLTLPTVLSLSRIIGEHKNAYYKAFVEAEDKLNCGELTFFVAAVLDFIAQGQAELIELFEVQAGQQTKAQGLCRELVQEADLPKPAASLLETLMIEHLCGIRQGMTLDEASEQLDLGKQSARAYLGQLEGAGLAQYVGRRPLRLAVSEEIAGQLRRE
ncbi:cell division protein Fic [Bombiscardovia apis]|uniref:Cell division protein Fic n=1 Tax=Bombiscardovia apis TaxID=2932182 RepID=A0ABN6SFY7_9BIFI|nr:Fic family protein [Bombiscardovia apis]BDR54166.1 cell division protein Fic [Bombiscardovia apis]